MLKFIVLLLSTFIIYFFGIGQTSKTVCNGYWNDPQTWEGQETPQAGDTIEINHYVSFLDTLKLNENQLIINELGELCGDQYFIIPENSQVKNYGELRYSAISLADTLWNYGHIESIFVYITSYFINVDGGSINIVDELSCFNRPVCTPAIFRVGDSLHCNIKSDSYQWFFEGDTLDSFTTRNIDPPFFGDYNVALVDEFGNYSELSDVYTHQAAAITTNESIGFNIYPNPSKDVFFISASKAIHYSVVDNTGKVILKSSTDKSESFNLSEYQPGVYFFISENGHIKHKIVLK